MTPRRALWGAAALMLALQGAAAQAPPPGDAVPTERPEHRPDTLSAPTPVPQEGAAAAGPAGTRGDAAAPTAKANGTDAGEAEETPTAGANAAGKAGAVRPLSAAPSSDPASSPAPDPAASPPGAVPPGAPDDPAAPPAHSLLREDDFSFAACRLELAMLGTEYTQAPPVTDEAGRDCGIDRPLRVTAVLPGVALEGGALMRCDTARALGWWMRDVVQPAARRLPGAPRVTAIAPGSTYQCRGTVGASTAKLSEHALGNAVDVASFTFDDGTTLPVEASEAGSAAQAFLLAVRWAACMTFTTVLGPGSNAAHDNHLHLDIRQRSGGFRLCE